MLLIFAARILIVIHDNYTPSTEPNTPRMDLKHNIMASEVEVTQTRTEANETHHLISTEKVEQKPHLHHSKRIIEP